MTKMKQHCLLLTVLLGFTACNNEVNVDHIPVEIALQRFDKDLQLAATDTTLIPSLREKYNSFFELYNVNIIEIGDSQGPYYASMLQNFMQAEIVAIAHSKVVTVFLDETTLNTQLTNGFKHLSYYFPDMLMPKVYAYVSGFNTSLMLMDNAVAVGLDRYLGGDDIYDELNFPRYRQYNMRPERIPIECLQAWVDGEYLPEGGGNSNLLQEMIHAGKIAYINTLCFPKAVDTLLFGFSAAQMRWCKDNEKGMWISLLENQDLYKNDYFLAQKYISEAPFTTAFSQASPGRACVWIGYRIVAAYMKKNKTTVPDMMLLDAQSLLKESRYNP
ncbi:MAG: hypothetical protein FWH23_01700 [Bacteroidales bacterium]|nr:hypothetical protein [Bacteroidales bacterium]MCL2133721.1 hypothetical protein [Bacteroidales bacterium]